MTDDPIDATAHTVQQILLAITQITQHVARLHERQQQQRLHSTAAMRPRLLPQPRQRLATRHHPRRGQAPSVASTVWTVRR